VSQANTLTPFPQSKERRTWQRKACDRAAFCCSLTPQDFIFWTARARDVSIAGISLILSHRFDPGTILAVEMLSANKTSSHTLRVRVAHATALDGQSWILGCELDSPLNDTELEALL
jgi:hypothetical protein